MQAKKKRQKGSLKSVGAKRKPAEKGTAAVGEARNVSKPVPAGAGPSAEAGGDLSPSQKGRPAKAAEPAPQGQGLSRSGRSPNFHVVGIGSSAGGLDALHELFSHMPSDTGMAFVVISHLSPGHVSVMPELLRKYTSMRVYQIESGMRLRPNSIYVTPPNSEVAMIGGSLTLMEAPESRVLRLPIDYFLRSLAQDQGDRSVAVILSGSGSDGSSGIREVKAELGLVVVQDPATAKYDGMPRSAIASGVVDYILPAAEIPSQLVKYIRHIPLIKPKVRKPVKKKASDPMEQILLIIRDQTRHDFSSYKRSTIIRRIERRMNVHQIDTLVQYAEFLRRNPNESKILFQELLIGVTSFFRDPKAFEALKEALFLRLKNKPAEYVFRVWVPGCSSGEEAYSVGIILRECLDSFKKKTQVQMFGTDIDLKAIERARSGIYPAGISADVSPERLSRFFVKKENTFLIRKEIREMAIFAPQNLIKDPPFIKLDLLCCRNLLIYLEAEIQKKLIPLFHYALKPGGILFLGTSETIGESHGLFSALDRKWRIFVRRETSPAAQVDLPPLSFKAKIRLPIPRREPHPAPRHVNISDRAERLILEKFAPPSVVVNQNGDILYVHGRTGRFLEPSTGDGGFMNILKMSREGLRLELQGALRKAAASNEDVDVEDLTIRVNGSTVRARISVKSIGEGAGSENLMLVVFQELPSLDSPARREGKARKKDPRVEELQRDLRYTKEYLQGTIEELETSNEELKSANEELQSTNEELQSTNEELETSQEELQSLNEEHVTLNAELQSRVDELTQSENDMKNLLESTEIAMIFIDSDLRVTRFTSRATKIVSLISTDIGRPLADIVINLCDESLISDAQEVLRTLIPKEKEVQTKNGECGRWYLMRMKPYRTVENVINGLVLTFIDIHERKTAVLSHGKALDRAADVQCLAEEIIGLAGQPFLVLDKQLRVTALNAAYGQTFKTEKSAARGMSLFELQGGAWDLPLLKEALGNLVVTGDDGFRDTEVERDFAGLGHRKLLVGARKLPGRERGQDIIVVSIRDVTEPKPKS